MPAGFLERGLDLSWSRLPPLHFAQICVVPAEIRLRCASFQSNDGLVDPGAFGAELLHEVLQVRVPHFCWLLAIVYQAWRKYRAVCNVRPGWTKEILIKLSFSRECR